MTTELGQICSDIGKADITDVNDCKQAEYWLDALDFSDHSTPNPGPNITMGCIASCSGDGTDCSDIDVSWTPLKSISPDYAHAIMGICLNSGKYILVH